MQNKQGCSGGLSSLSEPDWGKWFQGVVMCVDIEPYNQRMNMGRLQSYLSEDAFEKNNMNIHGKFFFSLEGRNIFHPYCFFSFTCHQHSPGPEAKCL